MRLVSPFLIAMLCLSTVAVASGVASHDGCADEVESAVPCDGDADERDCSDCDSCACCAHPPSAAVCSEAIASEPAAVVALAGDVTESAAEAPRRRLFQPPRR